LRYIQSLLLLLLVIPLLTFSAPLPARKPKPKPAPVPTIQGQYEMHWGGHQAPVTFAPGGLYVCPDWYGSAWGGTWQVKDGVLTVHERLITDDSPDAYWTWTTAVKPSFDEMEWTGDKHKFRLVRMAGPGG
jgi:hypothetical protein